MESHDQGLCHYCGEHHSRLTREHFLPQRLMDLTGDKNRRTRLVTHLDGKSVVDNFPKMYLWACQTCREEINEISDGEGIQALESVIAEKEVSVAKIMKLLNLFDKIRTGYWIYRHKTMAESQNEENANWLTYIYPIKDRIKRHDRSLYIAKVKRRGKGLSTLGVSTPIFEYTPCSFVMSINDVLFVSSSAPFLLHKSFGMTWPRENMIEPIARTQFEQPSLRLGEGFAPSVPADSRFIRVYNPIKPKEMRHPRIRQYYMMLRSDHEGVMNAMLGTGHYVAVDQSGKIEILGLGEGLDFGWLKKNEYPAAPHDLAMLAVNAQIEVCSLYADKDAAEAVEIQKKIVANWVKHGPTT